jgi:hypothetical protein
MRVVIAKNSGCPEITAQRVDTRPTTVTQQQAATSRAPPAFGGRVDFQTIRPLTVVRRGRPLPAVPHIATGRTDAIGPGPSQALLRRRVHISPQASTPAMSSVERIPMGWPVPGFTATMWLVSLLSISSAASRNGAVV